MSSSQLKETSIDFITEIMEFHKKGVLKYGPRVEDN